MKCEIVHESMFLPELIRKTTTGRILMPDHGLDNHWDQQAMLELLNSIRKGFPIGTLTLYHTAEPGPWVNHAGPTSVPNRVSGSALYVMDGTERIRTIMGLLGPADDDDRIIDDIDWRIYYDLDTSEFRRRRYGRQQAQDIPVRTVLNTNDFLTAGHEVNSGTTDPDKAATRLQEADRLASAFRDYPVSITRVSGTDWNTARRIYRHVNTTNKRPRPKPEREFGPMPPDSGLKTAVNAAHRQVIEAGMPDLPATAILQAMYLADDNRIVDQNTVPLNQWEGHKYGYAQLLPGTVNGLLEAVRFLETFGVETQELLPYQIQLFLLAEFFRNRAENPAPKDQATYERLEHWFWATSFTAWFGRTGSIEIDETSYRLRHLAAQTSRTDPLLTPGCADPFPERFNPDSARCRAFILYLKTFQPSRPKGAASERAETPTHRKRLQVCRIVTNDRRTGGFEHSPCNVAIAYPHEPTPTWENLQQSDNRSLKHAARIHRFGPNWKTHLDNDEPRQFLENRLKCLIEGESAFIEEKGILPAIPTTSAVASDSRTPATT